MQLFFIETYCGAKQLRRLDGSWERAYFKVLIEKTGMLPAGGGSSWERNRSEDMADKVVNLEWKVFEEMRRDGIWTLLSQTLEKEMATHSSILAWEVPWTEECVKLKSMGLQSQTQLSDFTSTLPNLAPNVQHWFAGSSAESHIPLQTS